MMTLATTETSMMMIIIVIIQRGLCDRVRRVLPSPCKPVQCPASPPPPPAASRYMEKLRLLLCPYLAILRAQKNYTDDRFLSSQEQLPQWFDIKCEGALHFFIYLHFEEIYTKETGKFDAPLKPNL
jgi:hypothetical protein